MQGTFAAAHSWAAWFWEDRNRTLDSFLFQIGLAVDFGRGICICCTTEFDGQQLWRCNCPQLGKNAFKDRRGTTISGGGRGDWEEVPSMTIQCNSTRFLFIDEIEATGADTIGQLEFNIASHVSPKSLFKYKEDGKTIRPFGGLNMCFLGDFWQLKPTGQIALMSDVYALKVLESARGSYIMSMFWDSACPDALQPWQDNERVLHLSINIRSGSDVVLTCIGRVSLGSSGRGRLQLVAWLSHNIEDFFLV